MKKIFPLVLLMTMALMIISCSHQEKKTKITEKPMKITKEIFGLVDTTEVYLYTLTNNNGMTVKITNYGGIVTSILTPDKEGNFADVVLGFDDLQSYLDGHHYFVSIVGRFVYMIANGKFTLDGEEYTLATNIGPNHLH